VVSFAEAVAERLLQHSDSSESSGLSDAPPLRGPSGLVLRWGLVVLVILTAAIVPNLSCVTGYSGSFAISAIGFFLPALCHIKAHNFQLSLLDWAGNALLLLAGCAAVVFGVLETSC